MGYRNYQKYAETPMIAERSLDESTIVAELNAKSKIGSRLLLLGQHLAFIKIQPRNTAATFFRSKTSELIETQNDIKYIIYKIY